MVYDLQTNATQSFSWHRVKNVTPHSLNQHSFDVYSYIHLDLAQNYNGFFPASEAWEWFKLLAYLLVVEWSYVDYCTGSPQNLRLNRPLLATQLLWLSLQRTALTALLQLQDCRTTSPNSNVKSQNMSKMKSVLPSILGNTQTISQHLHSQSKWLFRCKMNGTFVLDFVFNVRSWISQISRNVSLKVLILNT